MNTFSFVRNPKALGAAAGLSALLLAACGGGGNNNSVGADTPPALSAVANQAINQDTTVTVQFTATDAQTPSGSLVVTATSSNPDVVPATGLQLMASGNNRTLTITPAADKFGDATITLRTADIGGNVATTSFLLTVRPVFVSYRQYSNETHAATADSQPRDLSGFTLQQDTDEDPAAYDALIGN